MSQDIVEANLAAVEAHFHTEAEQDIEAALDLYTDAVVWEAPARGLVFRGKEDVADNYRNIWASIKDVEIRPLQRFATEDRVLDDCVLTYELARDDFIPFKAGQKIEMRLVHVFEMRGGKISKEIAYEMWKPV